MNPRWPESLDRILLRALDFFPRPMPSRTDGEAIAADWEAVGDDMWVAVQQWEAEQTMAGEPYAKN